MENCNPSLSAKIKEWLQWDKNPTTLAEVKSLVATSKYDDLEKVLLKRISFGTAGLRGKMCAGYACMNDLVIIQTAQGLMRHLEQADSELLKTNGIILGYDGRYNSKRFSELTAAIFMNHGYKVHLFSTVTPTPFVPFAVTKYKCAAGVMVTASHNPKEDNGYKVYGNNGSQIISPTDKNIQKCILENLEPWSNSWNTDVIKNSNLLHDPLKDTMSDYLAIIEKDILAEHKTVNKETKLKFTYSAMHGVGYNYVVNVFNVAGLEIIPVVEQRDPDPEFSTVKFPNPEEGKSSLDLSFKTANQNNSTIILANDPDADRLACAEKNLKTGEWKVFTGNELGGLLGWWALQCYKAKHPGESLEDVYMLASTVSSKILNSIAKVEGFNFIETLTGFKWMGNKSYDLHLANKKVIFAFEEAIGFMYGVAVLDKDGVSAAVHLATMAAHLAKQNMTLLDQLNEIYRKYGYHISNNSYYICHEPSIIANMFQRLRNYSEDNKYPEDICCKKYTIKAVRDLTIGYDNSQKDNKAVLPVSKSSEMITFTFHNGLVATLRTSGTEPKIKYYTEMCASPENQNLDEIRKTLEEMVEGIKKEFFEPDKNKLKAQNC